MEASQDENGQDQTIEWVALLKQALIDEKVAPEILDFKDDIITAVEGKVVDQSSTVKKIEGDPDKEQDKIIYERDLQRTRWLLKAYRRVRIRKIEKHVQHYLHHTEYTSRLAASELEYAKQYFTLIGRHAHHVILKNLPPHFQSFVRASAASPAEDMVPAPDLKGTVMMRPTSDSVRITIAADDQEKMLVTQGDIVVVQYELIREQLLVEEVSLT